MGDETITIRSDAPPPPRGGPDELPPPRPGVRHVRVPLRVTPVIADDALRARVDRFFHWPMIVLALLVLPLLLVEHVYLAPDEDRVGGVLWWACWAAFGVIWLAFLVEFLVKIAIAECRVEYVKRNWLDVIIIVVPVLRPLRAASLAKTSRVFTLRGVGAKFARYVFTILLGLDATDAMLRKIGVKDDDDRTDPARMTRHELMGEVRRLRRLTDRWERWYEAREAYEAGRAVPPPGGPPIDVDDEPPAA